MNLSNLKLYILYFVSAISLCHTSLYAQTLMDSKVNLIKKIAIGITFPQNVTKGEEFTIGIVASQTTTDAFILSMGSQTIKDKRVKIKQITSVSEINAFLYPIIYLTEDTPLSIGSVFNAIGAKPTLLITEKIGFAEKGSDVNLVQKGTAWRYEINTSSIYKKKLFATDAFLTKAVADYAATSGKPSEETPTKEKIIYLPDKEGQKTIADLQERLRIADAVKIEDERIANEKTKKVVEGSRELASLRIQVDTITSLVGLRNLAVEKGEKALEEQAKAEAAKLNQLKAENEAKEKGLKAKADQEIANSRIFLIGLAGILAVISAITILTFIANQRRKKIIYQLEITKNSLSESNQQLDTQNKEIQTQKSELEVKSGKIMDSIRYAMTIQTAMLPSKTDFEGAFSAHFIMYEPKDIVSGDFYWLMQQEEKTFIAVADCTGHGVPGAFLSTVGNDILNEIVKDMRVFEPNEILSNLHEGIYSRLNQGESQNKDGMDICLCRISKQLDGKSEVVFAGAKRPIYYSEEGTIKTMKGDSKYIGGIQAEAPLFINNVLHLKKGERIYLTTDGYADTPNPEKRKFGSGKFHELIQELHTQDVDLPTQYTVFMERWLTHRNEAEIRDDLTVLAFEL